MFSELKEMSCSYAKIDACCFFAILLNRYQVDTKISRIDIAYRRIMISFFLYRTKRFLFASDAAVYSSVSFKIRIARLIVDLSAVFLFSNFCFKGVKPAVRLRAFFVLEFWLSFVFALRFSCDSRDRSIKPLIDSSGVDILMKVIWEWFKITKKMRWDEI